MIRMIFFLIWNRKSCEFNKFLLYFCIMKRLSVLILSLLLLFAGCGDGMQYIQVTGLAQGGQYVVTCKIPDKTRAEALKRAIDDTLSAIDWTLSGYNSGSLVTQINSGRRPALNDIFVDVFNISKNIWRQSDGAFDPSCAPLFDIWGFGFTMEEMPDDDAVAHAMTLVGMDRYSIVEGSDGNKYLDMPVGGKINFNAIAQGYTCDAVARVLDSFGCPDYLVSIGGEIVCKGLSARGDAWNVWIDRPEDGNHVSGALKQDVISVTNCGLVTSGNYRKYYVVDGQKYSHTIDPRTGRPVTHNLLSATVLAEDSATADALATAMMVLGLEKAKLMVASWGGNPSRGAYLVYGEQDDMKVWHTPGLVLESGN